MSQSEDYEKALAAVRANPQNISVSLLQRSLGLGYARAARLIDELAEAGVISQYKGCMPRVLLKP